jgi:carboxylesterase
MNPGRIIPSAEPFFFPGALPGRAVGCLLVHGFTGAPKEMRWLGEYLAERGYAVLGVRLAGHATQPQDLLRVRWEDWLTDVEDGWQLLSGVSQRIYLAGLSMGGMLSLLFASRFPVAGVIAMSTLHHVPKDWRLQHTEILSRIQPKIAKGASDWRDEEAARSHVDYPYYPTRAIAELRDLLEEMRLSLKKVTAPVLLINSKDDQTVRPEERHAEQILGALGSQDKSVVWIEGSGHVITRDAQRTRVFQATYEFIRRIEEDLEP